MSNELNGLKYDMIHIDEAVKDTDQTVILQIKKMQKMMQFVTMFTFLPLTSCALCKETVHPVNVDHPFFYDNLEMLEWKACDR